MIKGKEEITLKSIIQHMPLYVEFFDEFIQKFRSSAKINVEILNKIGEAGEARILAYAVAYCDGVTTDLYEVTEEDCLSINKTFNSINQFQIMS